MEKFITKIFVNTIAILLTSYIVKGIEIANIPTAAVVALVLGLLNTFVKPILILLTIPITIFTLGLFLLAINILIIKWASQLVQGFSVANWWAALWFSIIVSIFSAIIQAIIDGRISKKNN